MAMPEEYERLLISCLEDYRTLVDNLVAALSRKDDHIDKFIEILEEIKELLKHNKLIKKIDSSTGEITIDL